MPLGVSGGLCDCFFLEQQQDLHVGPGVAGQVRDGPLNDTAPGVGDISGQQIDSRRAVNRDIASHHPHSCHFQFIHSGREVVESEGAVGQQRCRDDELTGYQGHIQPFDSPDDSPGDSALGRHAADAHQLPGDLVADRLVGELAGQTGGL